MKVLLITSVWTQSKEMFIEWCAFNDIDVTLCNPYKDQIPRGKFDYVFNAGCGEVGKEFRYILNRPESVLKCIDKVSTFKLLQHNRIPVPEFTQNWRGIKKSWEGIVCRKTASGRRNEGITFVSCKEDAPRDCELYVQEINAKYEYRIVVFMGQVVGRYYKRLNSSGKWELILQPKRGFEDMVRRRYYKFSLLCN